MTPKFRPGDVVETWGRYGEPITATIASVIPHHPNAIAVGYSLKDTEIPLGPRAEHTLTLVARAAELRKELATELQKELARMRLRRHRATSAAERLTMEDDIEAAEEALRRLEEDEAR